MAYLGETLTVKCVATDPLRNGAIVDDDGGGVTGKVEFYGVGLNPKANVDDRTVVAGPFAVTFDADLGVWAGDVDTTNDAFTGPGTWPFKVTLSGTVDAWEYGKVSLKA